jgi:hypothetical protein
MQISGNIGALPVTAEAQTGADSAGRSSVQRSAVDGPEREISANAQPDSPHSDKVSISPGSGPAASNLAATPVYAEIWKGSVKLAQVDIHGHVTSFSGTSAAGAGGGGTLIAAQRAVQLAQQTGGEIRVAGTPLNGQTLLTRARLANAYNIA